MVAQKEIYRIDYRLRVEDGSVRELSLGLDPLTLEQQTEPLPDAPAWTELGFCRCPGCPLDESTNTHCPLARGLARLVDVSMDLASFDRIEVTVTSPDREVRAITSAQRAISSALGLIVATSACPHTCYLRPMARFHLPLATEEETVYRATSMYLLAQYFVHVDGQRPDLDLDGLRARYGRLQVINTSIAERLRAASGKDGAVNAVVLLDLFAKALPSVIDDTLVDLRYLFRPWLIQ